MNTCTTFFFSDSEEAKELWLVQSYAAFFLSCLSYAAALTLSTEVGDEYTEPRSSEMLRNRCSLKGLVTSMTLSSKWLLPLQVQSTSVLRRKVKSLSH